MEFVQINYAEDKDDNLIDVGALEKNSNNDEDEDTDEYSKKPSSSGDVIEDEGEPSYHSASQKVVDMDTGDIISE